MSEDSRLVVYRASTSMWRVPIVKAEVDRVSASSVWVDGRRIARVSGDMFISDGFDAAKAWLVDSLERERKMLQRRLDVACRKIRSVETIAVDSVQDGDCR